MRYKPVLLCITLAVVWPQCIIFHKKMEYNIPPAIPEAMRPKFVEGLEKGKILYKLNCADCHGIFTKGKDGIPNFTDSQIDRYSTRFVMRDPKNHAVAFKMHPEQLGQVLTYLQCRRTKNDTTTARLK